MKDKIILLLLFISYSLGNSFNKYLSGLKLENSSEEEKHALKQILEKSYVTKENKFQEIRRKFYQTKARTSEWKFGKNPEEESVLENTENFDILKLKLDSTFPVSEEKSPLQISSNLYITKAPSGQMFLINNRKFEELSIQNFWTKSTTGCSCKIGSKSNCACCHPKGCICSYEVDMCTRCGVEDDDARCSKNNLELGSVFGFSKSTEYEVILIMIQEKSLLFFKYIFGSNLLEEVSNSGEPIVIEMPNKIENLFYEEILTFGLDGLEKRRFLFVISELGASNYCYEIFIDPHQETFYLRKVLDFSRKGKNLKVFNMNGKIFISYVTKDQILQLEEFKVLDDKAVFNWFQQLRNFKIETFDYLEGRNHYFLLVKERDYLRVLLYDEGREKFVFHQEILAEGAQKFIPVKVPKGKKKELLLIISKGLLDFYTLNQSNKFVKIHTEKFHEKYVLSETSVFSFNNSLYLLITSGSGSDLYRMTFLKEDENHFVSESMMERFFKLKNLYDYQINLLENLEKELESFLSYKKKNIAREMSKDTLTSIQFSLDSLEQNIKYLKNSLDKAQVFLEDVVPKQGTKKVISGIKHFYGPKTAIKEFVVEFANTGEVFKDKESLAKIVQNLVQINDERTIEGRKTFLRKSKVRDLHTSTLNGRDMENFMTVNKPVEMDKATYINGIKVKNDVALLPFSTVYGMDLSEDLVGLKGHQKLGSCFFKDLKTLAGVEVRSDLVNSEYFKDFTSSLLTSNRDLTFEGSVAFSQMVVKGDLNSNFLMKVKTSEFLSQIISKDLNETLSVATFEAPVNCNELESNRINNEIFPDEFVVNGTWINFGLEKYFDKINFKKLSVEGYVDNLRTEDLITKSTSQDVKGLKTFEKGVKILNNLNILASLIDGVDLNLFMKIPENNGETSTIIFEEEVTAPGVIVKGKVNNLMLQDVADDLVYKDEFESVISGRTIFLKDLKVKNGLTSKSVNQIYFDNFVNRGEKAIFTAQKTFSEIVNFDDVKIMGLVDNVNLTKLFENSVFLDKPYQFVNGKKVFQSISSNVLKIGGNLNGRPLGSYLTKTTDQTFPENLVLDKVNFQKLSTEEVLVYKNGTLNGISMNDIRYKLEKEGNFGDSLIVKGDVYVAQELQVEKLNGRKTLDLYDILLRNEKLQLLNGDIDFNYLNIYGSVRTTDLAAGNATTLKRKAASALKTLEKNFISGDLIWDSIETQGVNVLGLVNNFKLYDVVRDSVFVSDMNTYSVKGPKYFVNGFEVGDLESNSINGLDLRKLLFSRTKSQVIYHDAHFEHLNFQNVFITSFNGVDISRFKYAQKREKTLINGPLTFKSFVHVSTLKVERGYIGEIDVKRILDDAVDLRAGKIIISGKKTFVHPPTFTSLNAVKLNNEKLPKLYKNLNDLSFDHIVVNGTVTVEEVKAKTLVVKNGSSLLCPSRLRSEFLLMDELSNPLIFENIIVYGNMSAKLVNGHVLEDDFLTKTTNQSIWTSLNISSMFTRDVYVESLVNGFKIPGEAVVKEKTKTIGGSVVHNGSIHIPGSLFVKGLFGGRNIKIPDDLIILTKDSHIDGMVSFRAPLVTTFINAVDGESTLNGMALSTLDARLLSFRKLLSQQNISESVNPTNSFLEAMENTWMSECLKTKKLQNSLTETFVEPHSFVLSSVQEFYEVSNASKFFDQLVERDEKSSPVLIFKAASEHWMINSLHFGSCETKLLKWNKPKSSFVLYESIGNEAGNVVSWIKLEHTEFDKVFLLAVGSNEGNCERKGSSLWSFDLKTLKMERVQELESAVNAIVVKTDAASYVYWNYGLYSSLMSFSDGHLDLINFDENTLPNLKLFKVFTKPGGGRLIISYFNDILDIVDVYERRAIFMPNVVDIEIVKTSHNEIVFLVSILKFGLTGEVHLLEAYLYKSLNLLSISTLPLESTNLILPLTPPMNDYDHTMIFALSANHPRILTLGGLPFIKTWTEFPSKLKNSLWAYDFVDSDNNFYLCFGDRNQIYTVRLEQQGMKYHDQYINCT